MKIKEGSVFALLGTAFLVLFIGASASADIILYDSGPISGSMGAYILNYGSLLSDSFTLQDAANLVRAQVGLWVRKGDQPTGLVWSIGAQAFGDEISSGTALLTNPVFLTTAGSSYDVYAADFSLGGTLSAGTYWLTLQKGKTQNNDFLGWDRNDGPSQAWQDFFGVVAPVNSESFMIYGEPLSSPVPEPGTMLLFVSAIPGLWRLRRRVIR